jgi:hypothetical protein
MAAPLSICAKEQRAMVHPIMHDTLGLHKVCVRFVPRELTEEHRCNHVGISSHMLKWYHNEGNFSFNSIIADNEIWIYHYEP